MTRIRLTHTKKKILNLFSFYSFYFLLLFIFHFLLAFNDFYVFHGSSTQSYSSYHYYLGWLWSLFLVSEYDCIPWRQKFWKYIIVVVLKLEPPTLVESNTISEYQNLKMMFVLLILRCILNNLRHDLKNGKAFNPRF